MAYLEKALLGIFFNLHEWSTIAEQSPRSISFFERLVTLFHRRGASLATARCNH